jgi:hypothetical protein
MKITLQQLVEITIEGSADAIARLLNKNPHTIAPVLNDKQEQDGLEISFDADDYEIQKIVDEKYSYKWEEGVSNGEGRFTIDDDLGRVSASQKV